MEDQRNWTDASFKTYCRPLVHPFTYTIKAGETVSQTIRISVRGNGKDLSTTAQTQLRMDADGRFPRIALAVERGWQPTVEYFDLIRKTGVKSFQLRIGPDIDEAFCRSAGELVQSIDAEADIEIVLPQGVEPETTLKDVARRTAEAGLVPQRVIALPEAYLKSHQPSGPWPDGPTPADCATAARSAFPDALIGGGVLTNFTELNRCRPDPASCDFITHGTTAIVHAADDRSVIETIEALPQVLESASGLAADKPYRLGLVSIGMRSNPYGNDVAENPEQTRRAMAMHDPRQRGLFAAAFAVGALASMKNVAVDFVALGAPRGPFAITAQDQAVQRPYFDAAPDAVVYPIYHVVRATAAMSGRPRILIAGLPTGIAAVATREESITNLIFANLGDGPTTVELPLGCEVLTLNTASFRDAVADPDWLENARPCHDGIVTMDPFAVVFARRRHANG